MSIVGFFFCLPFAPYYIQDLGVTEPAAITLWASAYMAVASLALALVAPVWGFLADRYGRRVMLLRANFAGAVILFLMGMAPNVETLIFLRFIQGMFGGTVPAAQALVASSTPDDRSGFALGFLTSALFLGVMLGSFLGGLFAEYYGYRVSFTAASVILVIAGSIILFGVREDFTRPESQRPLLEMRMREWVPKPGPAWPIFLLLMVLGTTRQFDNALFPLLVQDIIGSKEGAAFWTGTIMAGAGMAGFISSIILGRLADRFTPAIIGRASASLSSALILPHALTSAITTLMGLRVGVTFFAAGLEPVMQAWLARITPRAHRGAAFGWAASARFIGWFIAPLISGTLASVFGLRSIYFVGSVLFLALIPLINFVAGKLSEVERQLKSEQERENREQG